MVSRGDQKYPSEPACDCNLNILALSTLYGAFIDRSFDALSIRAEFGGELFDILVMLVYGINPLMF